MMTSILEEKIDELISDFIDNGITPREGATLIIDNWMAVLNDKVRETQNSINKHRKENI